MARPLALVSLAAACAAPALADFLGPSYPAPMDLTSNQSLVAAAWRNLSSTLQTYLGGGYSNRSAPAGAIPGLENVTFSLEMFSLNDPSATELQFHYTSPEIANAPNGTHNVDANSIYRIASVTKVFTVLSGLINFEPADWERPLTEIIPTFADFVQANPGENNPAYITQWDKITPSALAAQIAGVPRDIIPYTPNDIELLILQRLAAGLPVADPTTIGLPPINRSDPLQFPPCIFYNNTVCPETPYAESAENRAPAFQPWTSPAYANDGFVLLGLAIANITGKSMDQVYRESIFDPLNMTSSNSSTPPESEWSRCVIPGDPATDFAIDVGLLVSSGGLLSTTSDLAKLGVGILNSTLLPSDQTRKWLKPVSHTARWEYSVGRPWEIMRYVHPSGHITDIYPKLGDSGAYSSFLVLIPDYNAGFTVLASSTMSTRFEIVAALTELINDSILPALEAQAVAESKSNLVGTYTSTVQGVNSLLTLVLNQTETSPPGLVISSWTSNGTDIINLGLFGPTPWRLLPTIQDPKNGQTAFRLVTASDAPSPPTPPGLFSGPGFVSGDWLDVDALTYGGIGLGLFVFDVDSDGKALAVSPAALRITLDKTA